MGDRYYANYTINLEVLRQIPYELREPIDNARPSKHNSDMNRLPIQRRAQILACLCEGNSVRATCRLTNSSKDAVLKLIEDMGAACLEYQSKTLRNLASERVQCDEIWSFVYSKAKNVPVEHQGELGFGDVWTWTAIDADSKLVIHWHVGRRDARAANAFMREVAARIATRIQMTTDAFNPYPTAVYWGFGKQIDYAQLVKRFGSVPAGAGRYSPPVCTGAEKRPVFGNPDPEHISTSYVERQNLSMRMGMRRFTRLTNAFSKKIANHAHAVAIFYMFYNFARVHQTLKTTPAIRAGIADHIWTMEDIAGLIK
jgi:IS1 family transposase